MVLFLNADAADHPLLVALDLTRQLLEYDVSRRLSVTNTLQHNWLTTDFADVIAEVNKQDREGFRGLVSYETCIQSDDESTASSIDSV